MKQPELIHGDCQEVMKSFPDGMFDAIVTDPPYGLLFMGAKWDYELPPKEVWIEALRVSKPGAWLLAFGGSRTYHRLTCSIEDAGWDIRDCIMWVYGSGFPKGKGCLKPSYEPIILARKRAPRPELNIDSCRIETKEKWSHTCHDIRNGGLMDKKGRLDRVSESHESGRWPANIIFDEEAGRLLDEQSGFSNSSSALRHNKPRINQSMSGSDTGHTSSGHDDSGGASRYFYCPKASPSERKKGLDEGEFHSTVKPLKLMEYLVRLVMPKGGLVLDPFAGSGTTLIAAMKQDYKAYGIEREQKYIELAKKKIEAFREESPLPLFDRDSC